MTKLKKLLSIMVFSICFMGVFFISEAYAAEIDLYDHQGQDGGTLTNTIQTAVNHAHSGGVDSLRVFSSDGYALPTDQGLRIVLPSGFTVRWEADLSSLMGGLHRR